MLKSKWLWMAVALAVGFAFPAVWYSFTLDSGMGGYSLGTLDRTIERVVLYSSMFKTEMGAVTLGLALIGFIAHGHSLVRRGSSKESRLLAHAMAALFLAAMLFHILQPADVASARYVVLAVAPLIALAAVGVDVIVRPLPIRSRAMGAAALAFLTVVNFAAAKPAWTERKAFGYHDAISSLDAQFGVAGKRMLVVSDDVGEGALVSDVATRSLTPRPTVLRGSKVIAFDDWNGQNFRMKLNSAEELMREIEELHVTFFVVDDSVTLRYTPLVRDLFAAYGERFELIQKRREGRVLSVYRLRHMLPGPAKKIRIEVAALSRVIEQR